MSSNSFSFNNSVGSNSLRKKSKVNIEEYPHNNYNNSWNTVGMSFTEPLNSSQQKRYDISQRVQQQNPVDFDDSLSAFTWKNFLKFSGPGWLMSIAYLDPGNLESDLQASALCGNKLVWVLFWSHVLGFFFQNLASRLGVVTGKDLSQHIRKQYPSGVRNLLWFMTEAAIIGSDIQEVIGTAIALYILLGIPFWLGVIVTIIDTMTFLLLQQYGMRKLELFFISLILVMGSCFVAELLLTDIYVESIISGLLLPTIPPKAMVQTAGMIGAVIMPHNIYLHSGLVSRRNIDRLDRNSNEVKIANQFFLVENASALLVSFLINLSIMAVFSQVFYYSRGEVPSTNVGLVDASQALSASLGSLSKYLWAIGLLAAGQCSTMTGTLAGQYVMEGFWKYSLDPWKRILFTRSLAIIPSIITTIVAADYLDVLGEYLNALQSLQLPFAIIPLLKFTFDIKLMGAKFVNSRTTQLFYIFIVGVIVCINMFLIYQLAHQWAIGSIFNELLFWTTFLGYLYCIYKVIKIPHNFNID